MDGDTLPPTPSPDYNIDVDKPKPTIGNEHQVRGRTKIVVDDKIRIQIRSPDRPHQKRPAPQPPGPKPKWSPKTSQTELIPNVGQASDHLNDWVSFISIVSVIFFHFVGIKVLISRVETS